MMARSLIFIAATGTVLAACSSSQPDQAPTPTATVSVMRPQQGSLPLLVEGYGSSTPSANGQATLSVPQPGQVVALSVTAGAAVQAGQAIVTFALAPSARSTFIQAVDALKAAQSQRQTTAQLLTQQLATRDQLAQADKAVADARTALAALRDEGAGASTTILRAPFAGVVSTIPVAPGDRTQPGQALATVAKLGAMVVTVGIDPAQRGQVALGAPAWIYRLDGAAPASAIQGKVARIDAMLNPRTRQIDVDIAYPAGTILNGEATRVAIRTGTASGWLVPHNAVVTTAEGKAQIFQISGGNAKAVPVTVRATTADKDVVSGAIVPNLPLIVDGAYQIEDGDAVQVGAAQ
jgi:RND family efflux transporter MFP subunit